MGTTVEMYSASAIIEGREWKLETTDDLSHLQMWIRVDFKNCCLQTEEGREQVRRLVADYEAAGSPPLRQIDHRRERIRRDIEMTVFLQGADRGVRYDHPGTYGPDIM